jgi:hypothetical protein
MNKQTIDAATEREAVKEYLQQYHVARKKKRILEERRHTLAEELRSPATGSAFRATPAPRHANVDGPVSVVFRIAEVEERIEDQREEMAKAVLHVMDLIDLLPPNSMERTVVEMRHIDCKKWDQIAREVFKPVKPVFNYYNAALDQLMKYKRANKLVGDFDTSTRSAIGNSYAHESRDAFGRFAVLY